jgi:hypothetical protein
MPAQMRNEIAKLYYHDNWSAFVTGTSNWKLIPSTIYCTHAERRDCILTASALRENNFSLIYLQNKGQFGYMITCSCAPCPTQASTQTIRFIFCYFNPHIRRQTYISNHKAKKEEIRTRKTDDDEKCSRGGKQLKGGAGNNFEAVSANQLALSSLRRKIRTNDDRFHVLLF